ncbi:unnamed protein product [Calicophoron daubneyi]|uniref:long-chain-fatty-acid--CoA ligase n=1 Tax=Calicophoron daubneyi TaxID=300641 RepID=A0AAV2T1C8_CALDB
MSGVNPSTDPSLLTELLAVIGLREAFRVFLSAVLILAAVYWYNKKFHAKYVQLCPQRENQTILVDAEHGIRVSALHDSENWDRSIVTGYDIFRAGLKLRKNEPYLGVRATVDSPVMWLSYAEVDKRIRMVGAAFTRLLDHKISEMKVVGIYGPNSPEWVTTMFACHAYGFVVVPLYDTLGTKALHHICNQVEPAVILCENSSYARRALEWSPKCLKKVIVIKEDSEFEKLCKEEPKAMSFAAILRLGAEYPCEPPKMTSDHLCMICYTSGSTGLPKGVMYTHNSYTNSVMTVTQGLEQVTSVPKRITHYSYLPLAHIYEQLSIVTLTGKGVKIGFRTGDRTTLVPDLRTYQPVHLCTVPRVLMTIHSKTMQRIGSNPVLRWLFQYGIRQQLKNQERGIFTRRGLIDYFLFRPVRKICGGKVELITCSGAPLSPELLDFTRGVFSCPVLEVYGSTEVGGMLSYTVLGDLHAGLAGCVVPGLQVKLADVPEMGLVYSRDKCGEICVKGRTCTTGYYKQPEMTKELFDSDGFMHMGDIGLWTKEGALKIVDRCKNIFKLAQGEYVAPGRIEEIYSSSELVANIFIEGDSMHSFLVAIVEPVFDSVKIRLIKEIKKELNNSTSSEEVSRKAQEKVNAMSKEELYNSLKTRRILLQELTEIGKKFDLKGFEQAKIVYLTTEKFTIENGLLTPTLKISRPNVRRHFASVVKKLYVEAEAH